MKVYVCDNDIGCLNRMSDLLSGMLQAPEDSLTLCSSLQELRTMLKENSCDLLLMDIEMGEKENGIDAVSDIFCQNAHIAVIYITGYALNYVSQIFYRPANVIGFLVKPVDREILSDHISRARAQLSRHSGQYLTLSSQGTVQRISCKEIRYLESRRHQVFVYTGADTITVYRKLSDISQELPDYFGQCHKSYLVNFIYVKRLERQKLQLTTGLFLPVSRTYYAEIKERYMKYICGAEG